MRRASDKDPATEGAVSWPASSMSFLADLKELEFLCLLKIDMDVCLRVPAAASSPESVIAALPSLCELQVGGNTIGWDSIF